MTQMIDMKFLNLINHHTNLKPLDSNNTLAEILFFMEVLGMIDYIS